MVEKLFKNIHIGDQFKLKRPICGLPTGTPGVVTMLCRDGLNGRPLARIRLDGALAELFVGFPTSDLDFLEGGELAAHPYPGLGVTPQAPYDPEE